MWNANVDHFGGQKDDFALQNSNIHYSAVKINTCMSQLLRFEVKHDGIYSLHNSITSSIIKLLKSPHFCMNL